MKNGGGRGKLHRLVCFGERFVRQTGEAGGNIYAKTRRSEGICCVWEFDTAEQYSIYVAGLQVRQIYLAQASIFHPNPILSSEFFLFLFGASPPTLPPKLGTFNPYSPSALYSQVTSSCLFFS